MLTCAKSALDWQFKQRKIQLTSIAPFYVFSSFNECSNTHIYCFHWVYAGIYQRDTTFRRLTINKIFDFAPKSTTTLIDVKNTLEYWGTRDRVNDSWFVGYFRASLGRPIRILVADNTIPGQQSRELHVSKQNNFHTSEYFWYALLCLLHATMTYVFHSLFMQNDTIY